jgi:ComF family protein
LNPANKVLAFGWYEGALGDLVRAYKYGGVQTLSRPMSSFLFRAMPPGEPFDAIVPVPIHMLKLLDRGFDQTGLLAKNLSAKTGVPVRNLLIRNRNTEAQAGKSGSVRRKQLRGAFAVKDPSSVSGRRILLLDDVITTGSTVLECARVLKRAGAARVTAMAVARTDRRSGIRAL